MQFSDLLFTNMKISMIETRFLFCLTVMFYSLIGELELRLRGLGMEALE